jgi:hypothetical protein
MVTNINSLLVFLTSSHIIHLYSSNRKVTVHNYEHLQLFTFNSHYNTSEFQLSDPNRTKGWSDNQKCQIIWKTNEKDDGKYQLSL